MSSAFRPEMAAIGLEAADDTVVLVITEGSECKLDADENLEMQCPIESFHNCRIPSEAAARTTDDELVCNTIHEGKCLNLMLGSSILSSLNTEGYGACTPHAAMSFNLCDTSTDWEPMQY